LRPEPSAPSVPVSHEGQAVLDVTAVFVVGDHADRTVHFQNGRADFGNIAEAVLADLLLDLFGTDRLVFQIGHDITSIANEQPRFASDETRETLFLEQESRE